MGGISVPPSSELFKSSLRYLTCWVYHSQSSERSNLLSKPELLQYHCGHNILCSEAPGRSGSSRLGSRDEPTVIFHGRPEQSGCASVRVGTIRD